MDPTRESPTLRDWLLAILTALAFLAVLLAVPYIASPAEIARVVRVVDGDTIWVRGDKGSILRVRIIGYDAPELENCVNHALASFTKLILTETLKMCRIAAEAKGYLSALVEGKEVMLIPDRENKDEYGRLLRYVRIEGKEVSADMLRLGYGRLMLIPPNTTMKAEYEAMERAAKEGREGVWEP